MTFRHPPAQLPKAHPLTVLWDEVEAVGGLVEAAPGILGTATDAPAVPTVVVVFDGATFTGRAPTYRSAALLIRPAVIEYIQRKDL